MAYTSNFNHERDQFLVGSSSSNPSAEIGGYHHNFITSRNPVAPQSFHANLNHSVRGVRSSSFSQRSSPAFRASSSSLRLGHATPSDGGLQLVTENYSPRHPRPLSSIGWRNGDHNGRSRISTGRYRSLPNEAGVHDRFSSEVCLLTNIRLCHSWERGTTPLHPLRTLLNVIVINISFSYGIYRYNDVLLISPSLLYLLYTLLESLISAK